MYENQEKMLGDDKVNTTEEERNSQAVNVIHDDIGKKRRIQTTELPEGRSYNLCFMI